MNYPAASCEVSNFSPPLREGDEGEGVENNDHKIPLSLTLSLKGRGNYLRIPMQSIEEFSD
jgi:hypothetical protein